MKWKLGLLAVIIAAVALYFFHPYFREMRAYDSVKKENALWACTEYEEEWPEGKHLDDVLFMRVGLAEGVERITEISNYLSRFPEGLHAAEANAESDRLWDAEMVKYEHREKRGAQEEAVDFMEEMLRYMKAHHLNTVIVDHESTLNLKEYSEYPQDVRDLLEATNDESLSLESGMVPLKSNFSRGNLDELNATLTEGVQNSLDKIFTPRFIQVKTAEEMQENARAQSMPRFHFDCHIASQEDEVYGYTIPHIWTYNETDSYTKRETIKGYLIGISILFDAQLTIPGSSATYQFSDKGEPADNIDDIDDVQHGYQKMTAVCFKKFANKMAESMGLEGAY